MYWSANNNILYMIDQPELSGSCLILFRGWWSDEGSAGGGGGSGGDGDGDGQFCDSMGVDGWRINKVRKAKVLDILFGRICVIIASIFIGLAHQFSYFRDPRSKNSLRSIYITVNIVSRK